MICLKNINIKRLLIAALLVQLLLTNCNISDRKSSMWSCNSCTFLNPPKKENCKMCVQAKPQQKENNEVLELYAKLLSIGYNDKLSLEAAQKYPKNINNAIEHINNQKQKEIQQHNKKIKKKKNKKKKQNNIFWQCSNCDFNNNLQSNKCQICSNKKIDAISNKDWICKSCTLFNSSEFENCEICGNSREQDSDDNQIISNNSKKVYLQDQKEDGIIYDEYDQQPGKLNISTDDKDDDIPGVGYQNMDISNSDEEEDNNKILNIINNDQKEAISISDSDQYQDNKNKKKIVNINISSDNQSEEDINKNKPKNIKANTWTCIKCDFLNSNDVFKCKSCKLSCLDKDDSDNVQFINDDSDNVQFINDDINDINIKISTWTCTKCSSLNSNDVFQCKSCKFSCLGNDDNIQFINQNQQNKEQKEEKFDDEQKEETEYKINTHNDINSDSSSSSSDDSDHSNDDSDNYDNDYTGRKEVALNLLNTKYKNWDFICHQKRLIKATKVSAQEDLSTCAAHAFKRICKIIGKKNCKLSNLINDCPKAYNKKEKEQKYNNMGLGGIFIGANNVLSIFNNVGIQDVGPTPKMYVNFINKKLKKEKEYEAVFFKKDNFSSYIHKINECIKNKYPIIAFFIRGTSDMHYIDICASSPNKDKYLLLDTDSKVYEYSIELLENSTRNKVPFMSGVIGFVNSDFEIGTFNMIYLKKLN